jgi:hypothetical protein
MNTYLGNLIWKSVEQKLHFGRLKGLDHIGIDEVLIFFAKTFRVIIHLSRVVLDGEGFSLPPPVLSGRYKLERSGTTRMGKPEKILGTHKTFESGICNP